MARRGMTLTQKILAHHAVGLDRPWVQAGDVLRLRVDWTIASELAWNGMEKTYAQLGRPRLHDAARFFLAVDHTVDPMTLLRDRRAQKLTEQSGVSYVVENRPGANTAIASEAFVRAAPDGYTIMQVAPGHATNPAMLKLNFDPIKDFQFITVAAESQNLLVLHPSFTVLLPAWEGAPVGRAFASAEAEPTEVVFLVWTTTPWTLPANLAIAVHSVR